MWIIESLGVYDKKYHLRLNLNLSIVQRGWKIDVGQVANLPYSD